MKENKSSKNNLLVSSLITLAAGILLCTCSGFIANAISWIIGAVLTCIGIAAILIYFLSKYRQSAVSLVVGALFTAVGIFFLVSKRSALAILPIALGIVLVIISSFMIASSVEMKKIGYSHWWISLIFSIIIIAAGLVLVFLPDLTVNFVIIFVGVTLIVNAVLGIITYFMNKKADKQYIEVSYREVETPYDDADGENGD